MGRGDFPGWLWGNSAILPGLFVLQLVNGRSRPKAINNSVTQWCQTPKLSPNDPIRKQLIPESETNNHRPAPVSAFFVVGTQMR